MMPRLIPTGLALALVACLPAGAQEPGDSVVKVYATVRQPDWQHPWRNSASAEASGSGAVIEGNKIGGGYFVRANLPSGKSETIYGFATEAAAGSRVQ